MTQDIRDVLKLALDALENSVDLVVEDAYNAEQLYGNYPTRQGKVGGLKILADQHKEAITAIKEALAQPEQEPVAWMHQNRFTGKATIIWDLGLATPNQNWKPLYTTPPQRNEQCNYPDCKCPTENPCLKKLAQTEQEPLKIFQYNCTCGRTMKFESVHGVVAPQRTEQNFCSRCGKRLGGIDSIHTCTPPMEKNT